MSVTCVSLLGWKNLQPRVLLARWTVSLLEGEGQSPWKGTVTAETTGHGCAELLGCRQQWPAHMWPLSCPQPPSAGKGALTGGFCASMLLGGPRVRLASGKFSPGPLGHSMWGSVAEWVAKERVDSHPSSDRPHLQHFLSPPSQVLENPCKKALARVEKRLKKKKSKNKKIKVLPPTQRVFWSWGSHTLLQRGNSLYLYLFICINS